MSHFHTKQGIERQAALYLEPHLERVSNGRLVKTDKGRLSRLIQETYGDYFYNDRGGEMFTVETKAEQRFTGNVFIETWSNKRGGNPGWLYKLNADLLWCFYLDRRQLFEFPFPRLYSWTAQHDGRGEFAGFPEKVCGAFTKGLQLNDTWGRCVPIGVLRQRVGCRVYQFPSEPPVQRDMFNGPVAERIA